ncbi:hypothetical protein QE449_000969 [Rhodococcus sp. SORGH_AS303]|nr:hypothetical protein [Rhodococcus sp. SORGH_AS_0301]MDQ1200351.1 hypothetical protein [Rhodococcus sp. SORGH_AS_0303]
MTVNRRSAGKSQFGADFGLAVTASSGPHHTAEALTCCVTRRHDINTGRVWIHANCVLDRYSSADIRSPQTMAVAPGGRRTVKEAA